MKRLRSQGPLWNLPTEQREKLHGYLRDATLTLAQIAVRMETELGVVTSATALSNYYQRWGRELLAVQSVNHSARCACGAQIAVRLVHPGEIKIEVRRP